MPNNKPDKRLLIGKINGLFGIKGFVKVFSYTKPRENIINYKTWYLENNNSWQEVIVDSGRVQAKTIIAKLDGIDTPETAEKMLKHNIYINKSDLSKPTGNEYYWDDIIGMNVISQNNNIGKVDYLIETGSNDVLVIKNKNKEILIPFIDNFVENISLDKKTIWVNWHEL